MLRGRRCTDASLRQILQACTALRHLEVHECNSISAEGLARATGPWRQQLEVLGFHSCKSVNVRALGALVGRCSPGLRSFCLHASAQFAPAASSDAQTLAMELDDFAQGLWALHELRLTGTAAESDNDSGNGEDVNDDEFEPQGLDRRKD